MWTLSGYLIWTADTIDELYKARWDIEVFFKHLKPLFRVKSFVGTSANAVRIQMWCAMIAMLLLRYLKSKTQYPWCKLPRNQYGLKVEFSKF